MADLDRALRREAELIAAVRAALEAQRTAVAQDDVEAVDVSVQAIGRALLTLEEARKRRGAIAALAAGRPLGSLAELELAFDGPIPLALQAAVAAVRREAERCAAEAAINQRVLQGALEAADGYLQALFTTVDPTPVYQPGPRGGDARVARPVLVDRSA